MGTRYDWAGTAIMLYPMTKGKRVLSGPTSPIAMDMRDFLVAPSRPEIFDEFKFYNLNPPPLTKVHGSFDQQARLCWAFMAGIEESDKEDEKGIIHPGKTFSKPFEYEPELSRVNGEEPDNWQLPCETLVLRKGDCEDLSIMLASLMLGTGISPYCVRVVKGQYWRTIDDVPAKPAPPVAGDGVNGAADNAGSPTDAGDVTGGEQPNKAGNGEQPHAWVIYKHELGPWCIIDPTWSSEMFIRNGWFLADDSEDGIRDRLNPGLKHHYIPEYGFNTDHAWTIKAIANMTGS